jgi:hypothetical protein
MDGSVGSETLYGILLELDYMMDSKNYFDPKLCIDFGFVYGIPDIM